MQSSRMVLIVSHEDWPLLWNSKWKICNGTGTVKINLAFRFYGRNCCTESYPLSLDSSRWSLWILDPCVRCSEPSIINLSQLFPPASTAKGQISDKGGLQSCISKTLGSCWCEMKTMIRTECNPVKCLIVRFDVCSRKETSVLVSCLRTPGTVSIVYELLIWGAACHYMDIEPFFRDCPPDFPGFLQPLQWLHSNGNLPT